MCVCVYVCVFAAKTPVAPFSLDSRDFSKDSEDPLSLFFLPHSSSASLSCFRSRRLIRLASSAARPPFVAPRFSLDLEIARSIAI